MLAKAERSVHFEQYLGAASAPLPPKYRPRQHLQRLPHLTALNLDGTELDEAALSLLPPSLQRLKLPHLSPKALPRLKGLRMLRYLQLPGGGQDVCHALGGAYSCPQPHDCECRL